MIFQNWPYPPQKPKHPLEIDGWEMKCSAKKWYQVPFQGHVNLPRGGVGR